MIWLFLACTASKQTDTSSDSTIDLSSTLNENEVRLGVIQDVSALFSGISSEGQIGDYKLYNNKVQFVIQSDRQSSYYIQEGGGILDADIVRQNGAMGRDIIDEHTVMAGLGRIMKPTSFEIVSDGSDGTGHLRVMGTGIPFDLLQGAVENYDMVKHYDMTFQVDYTLAANSSLLRIETTIIWDDDDVPIQSANVLLLGKEVLHNWNPGGGFEGESNNNWFGMLSHHDEVAIALMSEGEPFSSSIVQDLLSSATPAISSFTASEMMEKGKTYTFVQLLGIGKNLSSLSDEWYAHNGVATEDFGGVVVDTEGNPIAGARVQVYSDTEAITMTNTDENGVWNVHVPTGTQAKYLPSGRGTGIFYDIPLEAGWSGPYSQESHIQTVHDSYEHPPTTPHYFARGYGVGEWDSGILTTPGTLNINIADGGPAVVKLFASSDEDPAGWTPDRPHGTTCMGYIRDGSMEIPIEPGNYRVLVHRGTRYSSYEEEIEIVSGASASLTATINPISIPYSVFGLDGHSHSAPSGDGKVSMEGRLMSHVGHGVEFSVSTEHDHAVDFSPLLSALGLSNHMVSIIGSEVSPPMRGHFNAYPIVQNKEAVNGGSPIWWDEIRDTSVLFDLMYSIVEENGVVQANHPSGTGGLFGSASYDIANGEIDKPRYWSSDFATFELLNDGHYSSVLPFYIDMLSRGMKPTPMGVSDSHTSESGVGINKTYVFAEDSSTESIMEAIQNQHVVVSRGPLVVAKIGSDIAFGRTFEGSQDLHVEVFAPDWMIIDTVQLYENGDVIHEVPYNGEILTFSLVPNMDAHYLVSASGSQNLAPIYYESPWAMGAAFFIDYNGDGWVPSLPPLSE